MTPCEAVNQTNVSMHNLLSEIRTKRTPVLVGLDPRYEQLPASLRQGDERDPRRIAAAFETFCRDVIDVVAPLVPAVKPQAAFFEQYGPDGMIALCNTIRYARDKGLFVVFDGKRNDIGSTAEAYADGILGAGSPWGADALTVSPYLGDDSLEPFVATAQKRDAGIFVLVKTSNPGGALFQDLRTTDGKPLYRRVAEHVEALAVRSCSGDEPYGVVGAVVGATWPEQLAELRGVMPHTMFLVPGFGSQGGAAKDVAGAFDVNGFGAIINNSRGILFAHEKQPYVDRYSAANWQAAVEAATRDMIDQLREATPAGRL